MEVLLLHVSASQKPVKNGIQILGVVQSNGGLVTTPMTTATALAQSLVGPGVAISDVQFTGVNCAGTFTGGGTLPSDIIGFEDGVILRQWCYCKCNRSK